MPPFIPHKRRISSSPTPDLPAPKSTKKAKPTLFETADKPGASASLKENKAFLDNLRSSDSESALSDINSDDFEDVLLTQKSKRRKTEHEEEEEEEEEDDDEIDWEDAIHAGGAQPKKSAPEPSGDLELTLDDESQAGFGNALGKKKGPSKIERQIRLATHCMHVQFLLFHNLVRNGWTCDKEIQHILIKQLPPNVLKEINKWKMASGLDLEATKPKAPPNSKRKGKRAAGDERNQRNWGRPAEAQEKGVPNMSRGDPLIRLLKILAAYWKKTWTITAPRLRKQGYKPLLTLEEEIASYKKDRYDAEEHGERVRNLQEFRELARKCEGSQDAGAQLFTALIRGLGLEVRLVASLQPIGFGWSKGEEESVVKKKSAKTTDTADKPFSGREEESYSESEQAEEKALKRKPAQRGRPSKGVKEAPIDVSQQLSEDNGEGIESDGDDSVIDVTPMTSRKRPNINFDRDMVYPTYWTECVSPITHQIYPVDPFILNPAVATSQEHLNMYESRGTKADKAKQVFAYVIGYNPDGTAKDVTTRYLKRHMWPGRTKGVRLPVEKVPVYNHRGKIKRYEAYDWFKTVMSGYSKSEKMRTKVDDIEEANDLKAVKPEKKETKAGEDTLQGYKTSAEFVLERHLRREEAIKPGSRPIKTFAVGKGDKAKDEPVWLRKDVEICRTGESWHKEGRIIKAEEIPMKMVPIRAVTLTRKREVEEAERNTGEKLKQGLYSWDQTDWIIPPPIQNGEIPKNAYGNIDCFVPTMVPKGAVHIPLRSTKRICTRLNINYAEAVTGFEFGNKRAVPVITGVVVAEEHENAVIDQWKKDEEERKIKEEGKREKAALAAWRKWLMGLRIIQRVHDEYSGNTEAHIKEGINPFTNPSKAGKASRIEDEPHTFHNAEAAENGNDEELGGGFLQDDEMERGGFLPEGHDEIPPNKTELTIEQDESVKNIPPILTSLANGHHEDNSYQPFSSESEKPEEMKPSSDNETLKNKPKKRPTPHKAVKTTTPKEPSTNGKKCKASASDDEMSVAPSSKRKTSSASKRQPARRSKTATKSQYFEHDTDEEEEEEERGEDSYNTPVSEVKSAKEPATATKRKRGRPRKST